MRAQGVPGDQHGISVKVAATGPGYRLRVVDGSPYSTGLTHPEYTASGRRVPARATRSGSSPEPGARRVITLCRWDPVTGQVTVHDQSLRSLGVRGGIVWR